MRSIVAVKWAQRRALHYHRRPADSEGRASSENVQAAAGLVGLGDLLGGRTLTSDPFHGLEFPRRLGAPWGELAPPSMKGMGEIQFKTCPGKHGMVLVNKFVEGGGGLSFFKAVARARIHFVATF